MLGSTLLTVPLLLASAATIGAVPAGRHRNHNQCLSDSDAQELIDGYTYLLTQPTGANFESIANDIISDSFSLWSDSLNSILGKPLGTATWSSKSAFIAGQSKIPAAPNFQTLETFHTCDQIAWRWSGASNDQKHFVKAIITMDVDVAKTQITTLYDEFNKS